jgi:inosine/xanthosine triphosphate pyrophosphatase family protein
MPPQELNFITGNKNKLAEVQAILGAAVHLSSQSLDLVEIQGTIEEISIDKCQRAAIAVCTTGSMLLVDLSKSRVGARTGIGGRHCSELQCPARLTGSIHVCTLSWSQSQDKG